MSGMGRSGTLHAWQQEDVTPDIQTIGKGLGGGYASVAGMLISPRVANAIDEGSGYDTLSSPPPPMFLSEDKLPTPSIAGPSLIDTHIRIIPSDARRH